MPARTRVTLPLEHDAAVRRVKHCLYELVGMPTVDDRFTAPLTRISAQKTEVYTSSWLGLRYREGELDVAVWLRPGPNPGTTEAIVTADETQDEVIPAVYWGASARLVKKIGASLASPDSIWDQPGVRAGATLPQEERATRQSDSLARSAWGKASSAIKRLRFPTRR